MAYVKRPVYIFADTAETGVDALPKNRIVFIAATRGFYDKIDATGLTSSTTVAQAITAGNLVSIGGGGGSAEKVKRNFTATSGQTVYTLTNTNNLNIDVYVDGVRNRDNEYNATINGSNVDVTFITGHDSDTWVLIEYINAV